jgi:hypothetical protein
MCRHPGVLRGMYRCLLIHSLRPPERLLDATDKRPCVISTA